MSIQKVFENILPADAISCTPQDLLDYGRDWLKDYTPAASAILFPSTYEQVVAIVQRANQTNTKLVPSGGRTGLSGGASACSGEAVVSLSRLNKIIGISSIDRTLVAQAGVVTQKIQEHAAENQLYFPVDFASKGSSQIGGNAATNAGGIRVLKYGNFGEWVLGMKVVSASGTLLDLGGKLFKNQTGYDLKRLFIGSEGTLGIIVELTLKLCSPPGEIARALCGLESRAHLAELLSNARSSIRDLSAFEYFSHNALEKVLRVHSLPRPFTSAFPYYVLLEIEQSNEERRALLNQTLISLYEKNLVSDLVVSQNSKQAAELLSYRELISETLTRLHTVHKNDISVPIPSITAFLDQLESLLQREYPTFEVVNFGHVGDGNIHVNVLKPEALPKEQFFEFCAQADHKIFALVRSFGGSISAEHGVGLLKKPFLSYSRSSQEVDFMRQIKAVFDPRNILNPGKIFDSAAPE